MHKEQIAEEAQNRETPGVFAQGCCFFKLFWLFLIGAFWGDVTETIFCRITVSVWMSRSSVVYGPFSIVWGLGCAMFTAFLYKYKDSSDSKIFLAGTVLGGAYEYICSVFTEMAFGTVFWDYSEIPLNLGGRINLMYCFFWGIVAVVWLKIIYPKLSAWIEKMPMKAGTVLTWVCIVCMALNMGISCLALARYGERQQSVEVSAEQIEIGASTVQEILAQEGAMENGIVIEVPVNDLSRLDIFLDEHFSDERMERIYPNAKQVE